MRGSKADRQLRSIDAVAVVLNGALITEVDALTDFLSQSPDYLDATFIFVQAERSSSFDGAKLGSFVYGIEQFFDPHTQETCNKGIREFMSLAQMIYERGAKFKKGNPRCLLHYVTTGTWPTEGSLPIRRQKFTDDLMALNIFREVQITPVGAVDLSGLYRLSKHSISRRFTFAGHKEIPEIPGVSEAFLGFVPAKEFLTIIRDERGEIVKSLFYDNVRDFQGYNDVNAEIQGTLSSERKTRFVLMNNGITIITRDLTHTRDQFTIEDFQIVNGCQTAHVLFENEPLLDESVIVPLRLIWTRDEKVIEDIIHATNRQTEVKPDQFFAITEFARQLEDYFKSYDEAKRLYFERRSRQYDSLDIEKTRIINQVSAVRSFSAVFLDEAHRTVRSYKALSDRIGKDIFAKGHRLVAYYAASFALYRLEWLFRNGQIDSAYKIARYQILFAARVLANPSNPPQLNAHQMDTFCKGFLEVLWDKEKSTRLFAEALAALDHVANRDIDRDTVHTQAFTSKLKEHCAQIAAQNINS